MKLAVLNSNFALVSLAGLQLCSCASTAAPLEVIFAYFGYRADYIATNGDPEIAKGCYADGGGQRACNFEEFTQYAYDSRGSYQPGSVDPAKYKASASVREIARDLRDAGWTGVHMDAQSMADVSNTFKAMDKIQDRILKARDSDDLGDDFKRFSDWATHAAQDAHMERVADASSENTPRLKKKIHDSWPHDVPTEEKVSPMGNKYTVISYDKLFDKVLEVSNNDRADANDIVGILTVVAISWQTANKGQYSGILGWAKRWGSLGKACLTG